MWEHERHGHPAPAHVVSQVPRTVPRLAQLVAEHGWSQTETSWRVGLAQSVVSRALSGRKVAAVTADRIERWEPFMPEPEPVSRFDGTCETCGGEAFGSGRFCLPCLQLYVKAERARKAQVASVARQNATLARIDRGLDGR